MADNKTCGTCANAYDSNILCSYMDNDIGFRTRIAKPRDTACEYYVERASGIEHRCRELEQLAREMLEKLRWYGDGEFCCVYQSDIDPFAKRLRELGVSFDG